MKSLGLVLALLTTVTLAAPREIVISTEKIGESVHWVPQRVEVFPGEEIKFVIKHELQG